VLIAVGLLLIVGLTALTGYFVIQEFGYVAVDRGRLRRAAEAGDRNSARAVRVTQRLSFMLSGAQLGITVTALLVGYVAEPYLGAGLAMLFGASGISTGLSTALAVTIALVVSTVVQMVLGELAPKNLAIARSQGVARALAPSTLAYLTVAGPVIQLFDTAANRILRRVGVEPAEELEPGATPEDLEQIVATSGAGGHIDRQLSILLDRGLDFRHITAGEAMTARVDVVSISADQPCTRVVELLASGHSRFPVIGPDGVDDVIGIVAIADLLAVPGPQRATTPVSAVATPVLFLPAGLPLRAVLEELRRARRQLACVIDEYGGFAGVISLEDVAEELVGPIQDEDDLPEPAPLRQPDGGWLVPAQWRIDEVVDATGLELPESDEYDTLSGLILSVLGRIPQEGDTVSLPGATPGSPGRVVARVVSVRRHVPSAVHLREVQPEPEEAEA
jgi:CBS domain containing-hemolysin-like protein